MTHYFTGKPCKRGHLANRLLSDRSCTECNKEKRAKYYKENPEKYRELRRQAYAANPEKEREIEKVRSRKWRKSNPNHLGTQAAKKKWKKANIGKVNAHTAKRRTAKLQRTPAWLTLIDFERIENEYKLAALLSKITNASWHVDHIIPLQGKMVSGLHVPSNLRVIPRKENETKANKYLPA